MTFFKKQLFLIVAVAAGVFVLSTPALTQDTCGNQPCVKLENPIQMKTASGTEVAATDVNAFIGQLIRVMIGIIGSLVLLVFVYGGFLWLTSAGNSDQVKKGTQTMLWAAIGVFLILSSYAILTFVIEGLGATPPTP